MIARQIFDDKLLPAFFQPPPHDQPGVFLAPDIRESSGRRICVVNELVAFRADLAISAKDLLRGRNARIEVTVVVDDEGHGTSRIVGASPRPSDRF